MKADQEIKEFPAGKVIFREGRERNFAYLIKKGAVDIYRTIGSRRVTLARLGKGEVFGEMALINKEPRTASAMAAEPCSLLVLDEAFMDQTLSRAPKTLVLIAKLLASRLKQADTQYKAKETNSLFLSVCVIIDLLHKIHRASLSKGKKDPDAALGFERRLLSETVKQAVSITNQEIDEIVDKLVRLHLVKSACLKRGKGIRAASTERLSIVHPDDFLERARNASFTLRLPELPVELEYLDLHDFADMAGTTPEMLYKKLARKEIPLDLLAVHRPRAEQWLSEVGADFLKKPLRRKSSGELEDVDDVVNVDNATLEEVLRKLGYYKTGLLYVLAGPDARRKLLDNMSKKAAQVIEEETRHARDVDAKEAEDVQEDLIEAIRTAKRLSSEGKGAGSRSAGSRSGGSAKPKTAKK